MDLNISLKVYIMLESRNKVSSNYPIITIMILELQLNATSMVQLVYIDTVVSHLEMSLIEINLN